MRLIRTAGRPTCPLIAPALLAAVLLLGLPALAPGQAPGPEAGTALNYNLIDLIKFGGWVGYIIIFLSVVAVALTVEYAMSIRLRALAPEQDRADMPCPAPVGHPGEPGHDAVAALCPALTCACEPILAYSYSVRVNDGNTQVAPESLW